MRPGTFQHLPARYNPDIAPLRVPFQQELEIGLPWRMLPDLYEKVLHANSDGEHWRQDQFTVELRYPSLKHW